MNQQSLLRHAALRASSHPAFVAYVLVRFQEAHQMSESELASWLETENLPKLGLCRRPTTQQELQQVAAYAKCNAERLAHVLQFREP